MGRLSPHPRRLAVLATLGVCVLLLIPGGASAFLITLDVVLVTDRTSYPVGAFVNATVYVMNRGVLTDADAVTLTVQSWDPANPTEDVSLSHPATGVYRGTFRVTTNLTSLWFPGVSMTARADLGYLSDEARSTIFVPARINLVSRVSLSASEASPGDTVRGTVSVSDGGRPRDADAVNVSAWPFLLYPQETTYPQTTHVSTGVYAFTYTVPSSVHVSTTVVITGTATVVLANDTFSYTDTADLAVKLPDPFLIWCNATAWLANHTLVDIWVAGPAGDPVSGVRVALYTLVIWLPAWSSPGSLVATTDYSGRASFDIPSRGTTFFTFWGYATRGASNQSFSGHVQAPSAFSRGSPGFTLRRNNVLDVFEPGETVTLNYTPLFNYAPLNGTELYYVVFNATSLIAYGRLIVPRWSTFVVQFPMSSDGATLEFDGQMPNGAWSSTIDAVLPAMRLDAQVGPFQVGGTTQLSARLPASGAPWSVTVFLVPYNVASYPELVMDWSPAPDFAGISPGIDVATLGGSDLEVNFTLPTYLPANRKYYLEVTAMPGNTSAPAGAPPLPYTFKELVYVAGSSIVPTDTLPILLLVTTVGVVGVAAAILALRPKPRLPTTAPAGTAARPSEETRHGDTGPER